MLNCVIYKNAFCIEEESYLLPKDGLQIKKVECKILCTLIQCWLYPRFANQIF